MSNLTILHHFDAFVMSTPSPSGWLHVPMVFFNLITKNSHSDFRLETAIPLLLREINLLSQENTVSIAFPDEGAFKRFHTMFTSFPTITCTKIRDGDKRIVKVKDGKLISPWARLFESRLTLIHH